MLPTVPGLRGKGLSLRANDARLNVDDESRDDVEAVNVKRGFQIAQA